MTWPEFFVWLINNWGWQLVFVPVLWIIAIRVES